MAENQIMKMGTMHEAILDWLLMNPSLSRADCAEYFNVTESWLSVITNSDCFKLRLAERRNALDAGFKEILEGKMQQVVSTGLDRLSDKVQTETDIEKILSTTDKLLNRLGYGPKAGPALVAPIQNNIYTITAEELRAASKPITEVQTVTALPGGKEPGESDSPTGEDEQTVPKPPQLLENLPLPSADFHGGSGSGKDYAASSVDEVNK